MSTLDALHWGFVMGAIAGVSFVLLLQSTNGKD
jgi:hypothetical protein